MEIRPVDRLALLMLADIHQHLGLKSETDAAFLRSALYAGHDWAIDWQWPGIADVKPVSNDVVTQVVNILDMYHLLELSYADLGEDEKTGISEHDVQFGGFDGNNETSHMSTARFLIEDMGRFERFKGRSLNSHSPSVYRDLNMYEAFKPIRAATASRAGLPRLSAEEITQVIAAS